jgi:hypothetical protein
MTLLSRLAINDQKWRCQLEQSSMEKTHGAEAHVTHPYYVRLSMYQPVMLPYL